MPAFQAIENAPGKTVGNPWELKNLPKDVQDKLKNVPGIENMNTSQLEFLLRTVYELNLKTGKALTPQQKNKLDGCINSIKEHTSAKLPNSLFDLILPIAISAMEKAHPKKRTDGF